MKQNNQQLIENATLLYNQVYRFTYSRIKDEEAAKDIAQNVMEIAITKMDTLKKSEALKQWIMQITGNEISGYFRELQRFRNNNITNSEDDEGDLWAQISDNENDILQELINQETQADVMKALLNLEPKYQNVIRLHIIYEYPLRLVAEKLEVNINTIKTWYYKGLKILGQELTDHKEKGGTE